MKNKPEHFVILLLALIIMFLIFYANHRRKQLIDNYNSIVAEKDDTIRYERNDKGHIVAQKLAAEATAKQLKESYPEIVKELKEEFDVKMKDLKAYVKNEFSANGKGDASVTNNYYTDSAGNEVRRRDLLFQDGYLRFSATIYDSTTFASSFYSYSDTITTVVHTKRKWFLGKESLYASTSLKNPNAKVTGTTNLLVNVRDKRFVVYGGVGYDPLNNRPAITIGLGYALIKF